MEETKDINETAAEEATAEKKKKPSKNAELEALKAEVEALKAEAKEKDDKYLRLAAEYDNFRRRSREEKDATYSAAMADTVSELLPIIDNLERAAAFDDGEKVKDAETHSESIKTEWADFIVSTETGGADIHNPPRNEGGGIDLGTLSMADYIAARKQN